MSLALPAEPLTLRHRRAGIQGLRAVAVAGVVSALVFGWPRGGFLGVDVFFVIGGYLGATVLREEHAATGRIALGGYLARRARRLLPLALLVLAATVLASRVLFPTARADAVVADALWSVLSVANWHFVALGVDHFAQGPAPSPLEHFWSLGVGAQVFLFGLVLLWVFRRRLAPVLMVLILASMGWAVFQVLTAPNIAYYSTLTRAWELGLGALLGALPRLGQRVPVPRLLAWLGLIVLVGSFVGVPDSVGMPLPGALGAVAGAALVLLADASAGATGVGGGGATRAARRHSRVRQRDPLPWVLTNPVARYLGDLSYGGYLWYLPVGVLGAAALDTGPWWARLGLVAVTLVLAVVGHHLLELPIMRWPLRSPLSHRLRSLLPAAGVTAALLLLAATLPGLAPSAQTELADGGTKTPAASSGPSGSADSSRPAPSSSSPSPSPSASPSASPSLNASIDIPLLPTGEALQQGLRAGLATARWPADLTPQPGDWDGLALGSQFDGCRAVDPTNPDQCTFGNRAGPEVVVYGDQFGITLLASAVPALGDTHKVRGLTKLACAVNGVDADYGRPEWAVPCARHRAAALAYVRSARPDTLIMVQNYGWALKLHSGADGAAMAAEWQAADQAMIESLRPFVKNLVIVAPPMPGTSYAACYQPGGSPGWCATAIPGWWQTVFDAERQVRGVTFLDTRHWYCVDGVCPMLSTQGNVVMKADYILTSGPYAAQLAPDLKAMLAFADLPSPP